jgi:ubiquinone/menaquinone biosynthesis C-methylase UbiE
MKTEWDYSELANAYLKRPPYAQEALEEMFAFAGLEKGSRVCDVGAGVGHLTVPLAERGCAVVAVEPNDAMRFNGIQQTTAYKNVVWVEAGGEDTGLQSSLFNFVGFGSSFNVMDRQKALRETHRILKSGGCFACLWNHRDLDDPVQKHVENIIVSYIPDYNYGTRREDQSDEIKKSGLFGGIEYIEKSYVYRQSVQESIEAWASHATLCRQSGGGGGTSMILGEIKNYLLSLDKTHLDIPYTTRIWMARALR